jgi:hypothetical protein
MATAADNKDQDKQIPVKKPERTESCLADLFNNDILTDMDLGNPHTNGKTK